MMVTESTMKPAAQGNAWLTAGFGGMSVLPGACGSETWSPN